MSADGVSPEAIKPTATTAKKPEMKKYVLTQGRGVRVRNGRRCRGRGMEDTRNQRCLPVGMKEHLGKLFSGEELSEDFKEKASTVFEAAVTMRVDEIRTELDEEFDGKLEEAKAEMAEKLDQYLTYVVENWMKENQVAIEAGIKTDVTESFMSGLKELFETHYVTMPDE